MATSWSCTAGARAKITASVLVRSRARLHRLSDSLRHCEERSDEAIHGATKRKHGLLRFARNDGGGSALLRRNIAKLGRMLSDIVGTVFEMHTLVRRRMLFDRRAGPPLGGWPDRARDESAAAVRTDVVKLGVHAVRAEGTLI